MLIEIAVYPAHAVGLRQCLLELLLGHDPSSLDVDVSGCEQSCHCDSGSNRQDSVFPGIRHGFRHQEQLI